MTICYFGIYDPKEGRNKIYLSGLRQSGVKVIECRSEKKGWRKYFDLYRRHSKIKNHYDFLIVGYPGHIVVPLAKIVSRKKVVLDALCTRWEGVMISREFYSPWSPRAWKIWLIDWLSSKLADLILVETEAQRRFFIERFSLRPDKVATIFTGADDTVFHPNPSIKKRKTFAVVFRGKFLPEAGARHIIKAAKLLEDKGIDFIVMGSGYLEEEIKLLVGGLKPKNLTLISGFLDWETIIGNMLSCHVSLGQLEDHERLSRTIPHKAFESLALGLPCVTARATGISEVLTDRINCLMVEPSDPEDLARKLLFLKNNPNLAKAIAQNGYELFTEKFTPRKLAEDIITVLKK